MDKRLIIAVCVGILLVGAAAVSIKSAKGPTVEEKKEDVPVIITREDADRLMEEKLEQSDVEFSFDSVSEVDSETQYLYNILRDGKPTGEMLAVDGLSGEVRVYLKDSGELAPYTEFSSYDEKLDENIEWNGEYASDLAVITIEEQDPASFEYRISPLDGSETKRGYAHKDSNIEAASVLDEVEVRFNLSGESLFFGGYETATGFDGEYIRK